MVISDVVERKIESNPVQGSVSETLVQGNSLPAETTRGLPAGNPYGGVFQTYVERSSRLLLEQVQREPGLLSHELQASIRLTLSYSLRLDSVWSTTRQLLRAVAPKIEQSGVWDEWMPCVAQGIEQSRALGDVETEAELSLHLGHLFYRLREWREADQWLNHASQLFAHLGSRGRRAEALARLALLTLRSTGQIEQAWEWAELALGLAGEDSHERAYCHFVRGTLALEQLEEVDAAADFDAARVLADARGDGRLHALALLNLGRLYDQRELYEPAETYYEWAIEAFDTLDDPVNLAVARMNLGVVYLNSHKPAQALDAFDAAEDVLRKLHDRRYLAMVYNNRGMVHAQNGARAAAEEAYHAAIAMWESLQEPLAQANCLDNLGELYIAMGHREQAVAVLDRALELLHQAPAGAAEALRLAAEVMAHRAQAMQEPARQSRRVPQSESVNGQPINIRHHPTEGGRLLPAQSYRSPARYP